MLSSLPSRTNKGFDESTPADVTLAGFAGKRMGRTVPASINLADCDDGQFRFWLDTGGGERNSPFTSEHQELWIMNVDGVPLVIEAAWPLGASAQVQAELIQMVEIDPHRSSVGAAGVGRAQAPYSCYE